MLLVELAKIQLATHAVPVKKPVRHVPLAQDKLKDKLDCMESLAIIFKLDKNTATPWLNSFVLVKKPNRSLRVCLDPTNLNKYIVHPVCNMCTLDEINHLLIDAKFFLLFCYILFLKFDNDIMEEISKDQKLTNAVILK